MTTFTSSLGAHIAQIGWQTSTTGVEFMDATPKPLKAALEPNRRVKVPCTQVFKG
jgi:hypothetical protein